MKRLITHQELMALPRQVRAAKRSVGVMTDDGLLINIGQDDAIDRDMKAKDSVPRPLVKPEELERRAAICENCPHMKSVKRMKGDFAVFSVRCGLCGTCGMRRLSLPCPDGKFGGAA